MYSASTHCVVSALVVVEQFNVADSCSIAVAGACSTKLKRTVCGVGG